MALIKVLGPLLPLLMYAETATEDEWRLVWIVRAALEVATVCNEIECTIEAREVAAESTAIWNLMVVS